MKSILIKIGLVLLALACLAGCGLQSLAVSDSVQPALRYTNENGIYLDANGTVWTWGSNQSGGLGVGQNTEQSQKALKVIENVIKIGTGNLQNVALDAKGRVWQWGSNAGGAFGNTSQPVFYKPVIMMKNVKDIYASQNCTFALKNDGSLWAWGQKAYGILSEKTSRSSYSSDCYKIMDNVVTVKAAEYRDLYGALKEDGTLWLWGSFEYGQLGSGQVGDGVREMPDDPDVQITPQQVPLEHVKDFSLGMFSSAALLEDGSLWTWGNNEYGQIGNGSSGDGDTETLEFVAVPYKAMENIRTFTISGYNVAAIDEDDNLYLWGQNEYGICATGTTGKGNFQTAPFKATDNVKDLLLGGANVFVIKNDRSLWACGCNTYSRLGVGVAAGGNPDPESRVFAIPELIKMADKALAVSSVNNRGAYLDGENHVFVWGQDPFYAISNYSDTSGLSREQILANREKTMQENTYPSPVKLDFVEE